MPKSIFVCIHLILLVVVAAACTVSQTAMGDENAGQGSQSLSNTFTVPPQNAPPQHIQSLQFYKKGNVQSAPILRLDSSEKLILEFDALGEKSQQFRVAVTHRNRDWTESSLSPNTYLSSFSTTYFNGGLRSFSQRPSYRHFRYEFPNSQLSFKVSGNYLLSVYDYSTNDLLFSLPFFVHEDKGALETRIEQLFVNREDFRAEDQLFSRFEYPDFVDFPQFDLSYVYVQNQFWGRAKTVKNFDTSSPDAVHFHLGREQAFLSNYEFNIIDLRGAHTDGERILEIQNETTPPTVVLRRDIQAFTLSPRFFPDSRFGIPVDDRNAPYFNVQFRLETAENLPQTEELYLVGDFNNWTINRLNRLHYNQDAGLWEAKTFIKEGRYAYKYVVLDNGKIDDLALDQGFQIQRGTYTTFIYYEDPSRSFDRLLQVNQISRN